MNRINPAKLLNSKWTATDPVRREKHFIVTEIHSDENGVTTACTMEAVHSRRARQIPWRDLKDPSRWRIGWQ